jgi:hypothetical protein
VTFSKNSSNAPRNLIKGKENSYSCKEIYKHYNFSNIIIKYTLADLCNSKIRKIALCTGENEFVMSYIAQIT